MGFRRGKFTILNTSSKHCLAYRYELDNGSVLILHNLSNKPITISLDHLERYHVAVSDKKYGNTTNHKQRIDLNPYGYRWLIDDWIF